MRFAYPVLLTVVEEGGFVVTCRDLPEVITQGEDLEDAINNAEGALQAALEYRIEHGMDIPEPSRQREGEQIAMVPNPAARKAALYQKRGDDEVFVVRVDKRGRITIPLPIRQRLGIVPGDVVSLDVQGNTIVLKKVLKKAVEKVHRKYGPLLKKLAE